MCVGARRRYTPRLGSGWRHSRDNHFSPALHAVIAHAHHEIAFIREPPADPGFPTWWAREWPQFGVE